VIQTAFAREASERPVWHFTKLPMGLSDQRREIRRDTDGNWRRQSISSCGRCGRGQDKAEQKWNWKRPTQPVDHVKLFCFLRVRRWNVPCGAGRFAENHRPNGVFTQPFVD